MTDSGLRNRRVFSLARAGEKKSVPLSRSRRLLQITSELTKLRLVSLVLVTTAVGFLLVAGLRSAWPSLALTLLGTGLTAAGSMILNELLEAKRDALMVRTRQRPIPAGEVGTGTALVAGLGSIATGTLVLASFINGLTAALGFTVAALYVLVYTPLKTRSTACTLLGALCGAIPPMMGWTAASGSLGFGALLLAAMLFFWQIPHFLALAWIYREDYRRGGFKVLPVVDATGATTTALANLYIVPLLPVGVIAALAGLTGWTTAVGALLLGSLLLMTGLRLAHTRSDAHARRLFFATLAYLPLVLGLLVLDRQPLSSTPSVVARSSAPAALVPSAVSPVAAGDRH